MQDLEHQYHVHKFGGASVANMERFIELKSLLTGKNEIIVVSATQDTTSTLQTMIDAAKSKSPYLPILETLEQFHLNSVMTLKLAARDLIESIQQDFRDIKDILHAVKLTKSYSKEIQDVILGYGELWSTKILARYLAKFNHVLYVDASTILFIFEKNGIICIDWQKTQRALNAFLHDKVFDQIIITGFIASTLDGKRTILGRNGGDFSAAIFAKLLRAKSLTIWTDVDGVYTADPNKVRSAFVIEELSYQEASELAYFGAKVLHPMTIAPAFELKIPIIIKNSFNPQAKGTYITGTSIKSIKGLTSIDNVALINIEGAGILGVSGVASRVFQTLHQKNISVILIAQASSEYSICFAIANEQADNAMNALEEHFQFELEHQQFQRITMDKSCGILSAVGDGMIGAIGGSAKLFSSLAKANINIRAVSQGSSERNISVVINSSDMNKALQAAHAEFYLSRETISIGLIGPGHVGSCLLSQIHDALERLKISSQANLLVRGIMNSRTMLLSHCSINLSTWREQLSQCEVKANLQGFIKHILVDDIPHAVLIDCTANQEISKEYGHFLKQGIHVITPNKHANAGNMDYYKELKALTQNKRIHYLYEATVCAGLPVINTLQDLIKTGDQVERIEGVVSGTLSYIFNELTKNIKFSNIVIEAKQRGYTEPDPREDLSGMDVTRKFVCLAREIGFEVNQSDVKVYNLVPEELKSCSVDEFLERLPAYDQQIERLMSKAIAANKKIGYVGTINDTGKVRVAIESFSQEHPFSRLHGSDNMLVFYTKRYHDQPLVIQGPGAGTEVTAAGIFADLLRLVSFLS
ncbi:bifunctional aspartate kinase/homoserine dehydrogenase I [Legionella drancourtii]|uniref:Bifunctional aspartokinase/homoserine dehydrogenase n=1 Tax=Legionella drancourtii LLAP12 TaxID=658187 RepID=G9EKA9_9GAMM|nr:bifunctional aspartate kinase/homoserine dehydrogenase I [Legionella drancourtii]EHL32260.1 hypothetical protein LDG_5633 [Legionella drancourtii LLAP12]